LLDAKHVAQTSVIDSRHDGMLTVYFSPQQRTPRSVIAVGFIGHDKSSAPFEMPYLNSSTAIDVIKQYGLPIRERPADGKKFLYFRNYVYVSTSDNKIDTYGILDGTKLPE
jgi:hypothetical protein